MLVPESQSLCHTVRLFFPFDYAEWYWLYWSWHIILWGRSNQCNSEDGGAREQETKFGCTTKKNFLPFYKIIYISCVKSFFGGRSKPIRKTFPEPMNPGRSSSSSGVQPKPFFLLLLCCFSSPTFPPFHLSLPFPTPPRHPEPKRYHNVSPAT